VDEQQLQDALHMLFDELSYMDEDDRAETGLGIWEDLEDARVYTFEQAGVLTMNKGLVLSLADGSEFQLTIVRSR
jgi:hypothetical protein